VQATDNAIAALVNQNLASMQLQEPPGPDDTRAAQQMDRALQILTQLDLARGSHFAQCLLERARLAERLGDWQTSAHSAERAAAVADVPAPMVTEAFSRAGDSWYRLGAYDDASRCYLRAVRRRCGIADA
jgi:tetratricopeptide (TPR) repeat protein